jgi:hypothetical protein
MNEFEREMWRWGLTCALAALMSYSPEAPASPLSQPPALLAGWLPNIPFWRVPDLSQ